MLTYNQTLWHKFENKIESRQETINLFRKLFNQESINENSEYWTICGQNTEDDFIPEHSEFSQIVNSNLIKPHQFHGVDNDLKIIEENKRLINNAHFYHGSFIDKFLESYNKPEIINLDTMNFPEKAIKLTGNILHSIRNINHNCLICLNCVSKKCQLNKQYSIEDIIELIENNSKINHVINNFNFKIYDEYYNYPGARNDHRTEMSTIYFYRN